MKNANRAGTGRSDEKLSIQRAEQERRATQQATEQRAALATELGTQDAAALDALIAVGLDRETLPAVEWIPLVLVAWADGAVQPGERQAILRAAESDGIPADDPPHLLLRDWLENAPGTDLFGAWQAYLGAISRCEDEGAQRAREAWVRTRVREVAEADGGWLGFAKVSSEEGGVMLDVARSFRTARRA
jgi:hypothetical protein